MNRQAAGKQSYSKKEGYSFMKVLIIGGTGLISTAITRQLLEDIPQINREWIPRGEKPALKKIA